MTDIIYDVNKINIDDWTTLSKQSFTATWFQTREAYFFFKSLPSIFTPFIFAVTNNNTLKGICVGYITREHNPIKQFLTRRAIIIGGPMLANNITNEELTTLLQAIKNTLTHKAIYIETRNFNDYSKHRDTFLQNGFDYEPHLNFHVHTDQPWDSIESNIGKHRKKYIRLSFRDGAEIIDTPTIDQLKEYYKLLQNLYKTKVHMPCFPYDFFEKLYHLDTSKFLLVSYNNEIVGGSVCVTLKDKGIYEWFACGKDGIYKNIHPSSVTKYAGMKYATDNQYPIFDMMGAGKPNEPYGVRDFKAEFGGELVEHGRFLHICNTTLYSLGKLGVKLLKRK